MRNARLVGARSHTCLLVAVVGGLGACGHSDGARRAGAPRVEARKAEVRRGDGRTGEARKGLPALASVRVVEEPVRAAKEALGGERLPDPEDPLRVIPAAPRGADRGCLRALDRARVPYVSLGEVRGVRTPVVVAGPVRGIRLLPRAGRPPLMDCELARALAAMAPTLRKLRVTGLSFSGAYDYRTRRDSSKLSAHAYGLAIDVHALQTAAGAVDVARDYARNQRRWRELRPGPGALSRCVGGKSARGGRLLRRLACSLKLDDGIRVILTPDDNADHRDHLHIETYPARPRPGIASPRRRNPPRLS
jgi:hypothetical protein